MRTTTMFVMLLVFFLILGLTSCSGHDDPSVRPAPSPYEPGVVIQLPPLILPPLVCPTPTTTEPTCAIQQNKRGNFFYVCEGDVQARCWTEEVPGEYFIVTQDEGTFYCKE